MDTLDARGVPQGSEGGHYTMMSVSKETKPITRISQTDSRIGDNADCALNDPRFITHLRFLTIMQRTILAHRIGLSFEDQKELHLGRLHMLYLAPLKDRRGKKNCRPPTVEEWVEVERKIITLENYLTPSLLTYVEINHLSGKILEKIALGLLGISISALVTALLLNNWYAPMFLACFTVWSAATGALGSTAFLYVNALSIQVDPNVDLTSRTLVTMRLILGALFAVILTVPFGCQGFYRFGHNFLLSNQNIDLSTSLLLLFPFTLGFSTPLALLIMGRLIQSVRTFFGLGEHSDGRTKGSPHDLFKTAR